MAGLGFNIAGASWDSANIIASIYPQASKATIATYGALGPTALLGSVPTILGTPILNNGYVTVSADGGGYDTGVSDVAVKTMMMLIRPSAAKGLGMGVFQGAVTPQGDTFVIDPPGGVGGMRAIGSTQTGVASSALPQSIFDGKFYLVFGDYTANSVTCSAVIAGSVVSGPTAALATRGVIPVTIRVGMDYMNNSAGAGYNGNVDIAASGVWSTTTLTSFDKIQMYNQLKSMLGVNIAIA